MNIKEKVYDWKNRLKDRKMFSLVVGLFIVILIMGLYIIKKKNEYRQTMENNYNLAFFELVNYVQNVENYLLKAQATNGSKHSAEVMTYIWRESNLAQSYLSRLPISSQELSNTAKFLNQVSDYSYSLSRKNLNNEELTQEDLKNIKELHEYSIGLKNVLNQLVSDLDEGRIKWGELEKKGTKVFAQEVSNISIDSFSNLEENFHEYAGLIYDGAYSEHLVNSSQKGIRGENISEEEAKNVVKNIYKKEQINYIGKSENSNIPIYNFEVININDNSKINISISIKGGYIVYINKDRKVTEEKISQEEVNKKAKEFLEKCGYKNMKETYYLNESGTVIINYAYQENDVTIYSDLIKVKIGLDNGEILGVEAMGYLNCHTERKLDDIIISKEKALEKINPELEILSTGLAVIPTEWQTENLCWEFKCRLKEHDFLIYINTRTGEEEDILVIINTPNGNLTM